MLEAMKSSFFRNMFLTFSVDEHSADRFFGGLAGAVEQGAAGAEDAGDEQSDGTGSQGD